MPSHRPKKTTRVRPSGRGIRTDGAPRLIEPGGANNRDSETWGILWSVKGRSKRFRTRAYAKDDAERALQEFLNARAASAFLFTVDQVLDLDIERMEASHKANKRRPVLLQNRKLALNPIRAHFGALAPETIEPAYVDDYIAKRAKQGVGPRTISIELAYFRAAGKNALRKKLITAFPDIVLPQAKAKSRRRVLSKTELARLMVAVKEERTPLHLRGFVVLSLHTGQRGVHIKALRWDHVDMGELMILFTRSNPDAADNKQCADMPITRGLGPVLEELRAAARTDFVIEWEGAPVASLKTAFGKLTARAGLADFHIHDLRRSFATLGGMKDIPIEEIAGLMNLDKGTLRAHYQHGIADRTRKLIERIGEDQ